MRRKKKKTINAVPRPTHPGRSIYTAILHNRMSVGEIAAMIGFSRAQLVKILKGDQQLTPRLAFLLAEFFGWDLALRWMIMQTKCNMYSAAIRERKARSALMIDDTKSEVGSVEWEENVRQAWDLSEKEDPSENDSYPVLRLLKEQNKINMKEDLNGSGECGVEGAGGNVRSGANGGCEVSPAGEGSAGLPEPGRSAETTGR